MARRGVDRDDELITSDELTSVPPDHVLVFGPYVVDSNYRKALIDHAMFIVNRRYTVEEIVGSVLGYNETFPSEYEWLLDGKGTAWDSTRSTRGSNHGRKAFRR